MAAIIEANGILLLDILDFDPGLTEAVKPELSQQNVDGKGA